MADNEVKIIVTGDSSSATKALQQVIDKLGDGKKAGEAKGVTLGSLKLKYLAMAAAAMTAVRAISGYIEEAAKQEKADVDMAMAMRNVGIFSKDNYESFKNLASNMQKITVVGDDVTQGLISIGLNMGITKDKMEGAVQGAIGLNKAFGMDMTAAMKAVAQAQQGNFMQLSRYIPELKNATDKTQAMAIVNEKMANGFKMAQAETKTFAGQMKQIGNQLGDLKEIVGYELIKAIKPLMDEFTKFIQSKEGIALVSNAVRGVVTGFLVLYASIDSIVRALAIAVNSTIGFVSSVGAFVGNLKNGFTAAKEAFSVEWDSMTEKNNTSMENMSEVWANTAERLKNLWAESATAVGQSYDSINEKTAEFQNNQTAAEIKAMEEARNRDAMIVQRNKVMNDAIDKANQGAFKKKQEYDKQQFEFKKAMIGASMGAVVDAAASEKATLGSVAAALLKSQADAWSQVVQIRAVAAFASGNLVEGGLLTAAAIAIKAIGAKAASLLSGAQKMAEGGVIDEPTIGIGMRTGRRVLMGEAGPEMVSPMTPRGGDGAMAGNIYIDSITINAQDGKDVQAYFENLQRQTGSRQMRR